MADPERWIAISGHPHRTDECTDENNRMYLFAHAITPKEKDLSLTLLRTDLIIIAQFLDHRFVNNN